MNVFSGGILGVIVFTLLIALAIMWILMPIAIFGMKSSLADLLAEVKRANEHLRRIEESRESESH